MKFISLMSNKKVLPIIGAVLLITTIILPFIFSGGQSSLKNSVLSEDVREIQVLPGSSQLGSHSIETPDRTTHQKQVMPAIQEATDQHVQVAHQAPAVTGHEVETKSHEAAKADSHDTPTTVSTSSDPHVSSAPHAAPMQADEHQVETSHGTPDEGVVSDRTCYELGPVKDDVQKSELETQLQSRSMMVSITFKNVKKDLGYWVYLPPLRSVALGRLKVEEIKLKGIKDVNLLVNHEPRLAISLGIFRDEKNANARMLKAQSLGFDAKMEMRSMEEQQLWLVVDALRQNELSEQEWLDLLNRYSPIELKTINCP